MCVRQQNDSDDDIYSDEYNKCGKRTIVPFDLEGWLVTNIIGQRKQQF